MNCCERFYKENKNRVLSFLLRLTGDYELACDLVQESFTRYISRYDHHESNRALLFTIARNAALDSFRKRKESQLAEEEAICRDPDPERRLMDRQELDKVLAAIGQLDDLDRRLISLLTTGTYSYTEIGRIFDISQANVKVKVHRARLRLKGIIEDGDS